MLNGKKLAVVYLPHHNTAEHVLTVMSDIIKTLKGYLVTDINSSFDQLIINTPSTIIKFMYGVFLPYPDSEIDMYFSNLDGIESIITYVLNNEINIKCKRETSQKKKLFISCPMRGRTEENIKNSMEKMHQMAELVFGEELEVIPTYVEEQPPECKNQAIWYLGEAIKKLSEADYFIGIDWENAFSGCNIERQTAREYGIPGYYLDICRTAFLADCKDVIHAYYGDNMSCDSVSDKATSPVN